MSLLKLENITVTESRRTEDSFIIGDVVNGGGYSDPMIIDNQRDLEMYFRFSENYESYRSIITAGGTLALAGNIKNYSDIPTVVIFNQNPEIKPPSNLVIESHPKYEDLFKNAEELINEISEESIYLSKKSDKISGLNEFTGFSDDEYSTYRIEISPNESDIYKKLVQDSLDNKINILVLPIYSADSALNLNLSLLLQVENLGVPIPDPTIINDTIKFGAQGSIGDTWILRFILNSLGSCINIYNRVDPNKLIKTIQVSSEEWNNAIVLKGLLESLQYLKSTQGVFDKGEEFSLNEDNSKLIYEAPYLMTYFDFCSEYCKIFSFNCNTEFTQKIYYVKGLINQGIVLSGYSNFANREGRDIRLNFYSKNSRMYLNLNFLDEEYEYSGTDLLSIAKSNPLVTFTDINYDTTDYQGNRYESIVPEGLFNTNSYSDNSWDLNSLITAYESFFEYDINPSVIIAPKDVSFWRRTPVVGLLKKFYSDHLVGGFNSTVCIQLENSEERYMKPLQNSLAIPIYWFSGKFEIPSVYKYLEKWLRSKEFSDDPGYFIDVGIKDTLSFEYTGSSIAYKTDNDFILSLAISHLLNAIYLSIYPGIEPNSVLEVIYESVNYVKSRNPILTKVEVLNVEQSNNTLILELDIYYHNIPNEVKINFKIHKNLWQQNY